MLEGPRPRPLCPSSLRYELGRRGLGRGPSGKIAASLGRYANIDLRFYGRRVARGPGDLCGRGHDPTHRPLLGRGPPAARRQLQHSSRGSGDSALVCCSSYRRGAHFEMGENRLIKRRSRPIVDSHNEMTMVLKYLVRGGTSTLLRVLYYDCSTSTSTREVQVR